MLDWNSIPLLPLRCILSHLSPEDAVAAMSTCRHWRNGALLYVGHKDTLKLNIKCLDKCDFLVRLFKKNARKIHLYIDCNEPEIEKFMNLVFPQLFDTQNLQELLFIGPSYVQQSNHLPLIKLRRITIESLIYKNTNSLLKLGFLGCCLDTPKSENERFCHKAIEKYSRPLKFGLTPCIGDTVLSRSNQRLMGFAALSHIVVDYDQINSCTLVTLSRLSNLEFLSMNVVNRKLPRNVEPVDWVRLDDFYPVPLKVCINIIGVPYRRFTDIMQRVLVHGMHLVSLKVMFCKSIFTPLISHVARVYQDTLREMVWVDSPYDSRDPYHRIVRPMRQPHPDTYAHVNPFVLLCWQCSELRRLVIHGYWIWQYDVTGFVRLRQELSHLEVSAVYDKQDRFHNMLNLSEEGAVRVLCGDVPPPPDPEHSREVSDLIEFPWIPTPWAKLHPALRGRATLQQRTDFVVNETRVLLTPPSRKNPITS